MADATPDPREDAAIPMRLASLGWHGRDLHVAWDAPGATRAIVQFSADGATFRTMTSTTEPDADFAPQENHGIVRVIVTDGKRRGVADYRI